MSRAFNSGWTVVKDDGKRYKIIRHYFSDNKTNRQIKSGLTLEEAQAHCRDPATSNVGDDIDLEQRWFDGYAEM